MKFCESLVSLRLSCPCIYVCMYVCMYVCTLSVCTNLGGEIDLPQIYVEGNPNARKTATRGRMKGGKFTLSATGDKLEELGLGLGANVGSNIQSHVDSTCNNAGGFKFIEMVSFLN